MNYPINFLVGEAETAVMGLTLGNKNYVIARDLLSEPFGDNQALILATMKKLLSLNPILNISDAYPIQDGGGGQNCPLYHFLPCNFYKRRS